MKNSGFGAIGLLVTVVFILMITVCAIKYYGLNESSPSSTEATDQEPLEEARAVECLMKVEALGTDIKMFVTENNRFPTSLEEVTDDYYCPISDVEYEYDGTTGEVWCPEHR